MKIQLINKLKNVGISQETDIEELQYITFTNIFTVIACLAAFSYIPYLAYFLPESILLLVVVSSQVFFYLVVLVSNHFRSYFFARIMLSANALVCTTLETVLTNFYCDLHFILLIGVIFAFLMFPERERKYSYLIASCFAVCYILIEVNIACNSPFLSPPPFIKNLKHIVRSALLLLLFFFAYYAYRTIRAFQEELKAENIKMETEISLARRIQEQIIPSKDPHAYISSLYKPMEKLGGDFYDYLFFRDSEKIGIFLSDVSGHGVPAAFVTSMIKTAILECGTVKQNPSSLLSFLNDILLQQSGGNFVTAFYGIYDPRDRTMLFSNAGHNPPFIIGPAGVTELTSGKSVPLSIMGADDLSIHGKAFVNSEVALPRGGKMLLYTDGLTEARSKEKTDIIFETAGMHEIFMKHHTLSSKEFITKTYQELIAFHGSEKFDDDICLICIDVE